MVENLNQAHQDALQLLEIIHGICTAENLAYTLTADTLACFTEGFPFKKAVPAIYIAVTYREFLIIREKLLGFCEEREGYSVHDFSNTKQFDSLDLWFVKHAHICPNSDSPEEAFYYGARLVMTPLFYAGSTKREWKRTYHYFARAMGAVNSRAVLKGKPLSSYIRLSKKRMISNYLRRRRDRYSIKEIIDRLGKYPASKYMLYPFILRRKPGSPNSLPHPVGKESVRATAEVWENVVKADFCGVECYVAQKARVILDCFPAYAINRALKKGKSQLLLNGYGDLRRVQQIQLELLSEFDRICRKYGLRYNISFGTLLGAVRHKGFIPWDDDIDVTMPWEDYDKLDLAMERELDASKYYLRTPESEKNNHLIFKHLERKGTLYTKPGREKLEHPIGVFIDIFPMYPSAPNKFLDWFHTKVCRYWRRALWATVGAQSERSPWKRFWYKQMARPGNKRCYENFVRAAVFFRHEKKYLKFWTAMDRSPYKTPLVRMENYTDPVELKFEGRLFFAPRNYVEVLDYCFGADWSLYPVTESRIPAHNVIMDLENLS